MLQPFSFYRENVLHSKTDSFRISPSLPPFHFSVLFFNNKKSLFTTFLHSWFNFLPFFRVQVLQFFLSLTFSLYFSRFCRAFSKKKLKKFLLKNFSLQSFLSLSLPLRFLFFLSKIGNFRLSVPLLWLHTKQPSELSKIERKPRKKRMKKRKGKSKREKKKEEKNQEREQII